MYKKGEIFMFRFKRKNKKISMRRNNNISGPNNIVRNTLKEGDYGEDVEKLQNMLMSIVNIYPDIPIITLDGKYSDETRNAVECFQKLNGLENTGIVDKLTWDRLNLIYDKKDQIKGIEKISFNGKNITKI